MQKNSGGSALTTIDYEYDVFDRRVARVSTPSVGAAISKHFVFDGDHIALQFDGGTLTHRYLYGPVLDQILADEQVGTGDVLWPLTDNLGSVRDIAIYDAGTDTTTITNHIVYDAFGRVISETNSAVDLLFGYTGRDWDAQAELQYNRARWYDPKIRQWLSEDPIGFEAGDANVRRYVGNAVTTRVDPSGLILDWIWGMFTPLPTPENAVHTAVAYQNATQAGPDNRAAMSRGLAGNNLNDYLDCRLKHNGGIGGNHVQSGLQNTAQVAATGYQTTAGALAAGGIVGSVKVGKNTSKPRYGDKIDVQVGMSKPSQKHLLNLPAAPAKAVSRTSQFNAAAQALGYRRTNSFSHGQPVYTNGSVYITPDVDGHNVTNGWKMARTVRDLGSKNTRMGTYDPNLNRIGD